VLDHGVPPRRGARESVASGDLVRILAIAGDVGTLEREVHRRRDDSVGRARLAPEDRPLVEPGGDLGVILRGVHEGCSRELVTSRVGQRARRGDLVEHRVVLGGVRHDADVAMVLRRSANHGRPADVDELDRGIRGEGIQVRDHKIKRCDVVFAQRSDVLGLVEISEDARVNVRMKRLHTSVEHLGETGHVFDVEVLHASFGECVCGAARRHEFDTVRTKSLRKIDETRLVPHAQQRSHLVLLQGAGHALGLETTRE
jgi:hypothetical protein